MLLNLYGYWRSSASWRVRWALEIKKVPYNYIPVNILKGEHLQGDHLKRNPLGTLPVVEVAPENFLSQSMAILMWIEENFSKEPMIFGKDRTQRYKIIELCEIINADTAPLQTPRAQKKHSDDQVAKAAFAKHFIQAGLAAFEENARKVAGDFSVANSVSAADLFLIPQLYNAKRFEIPISDYPLLSKIWENCFKTPECVKSSPEKQIDAQVS
jgi:maleylacetoacetate isomerase